MQKLLQLPVNAVNIVKTVQSQVQGQEEDKSPVLTPDSGQQAWYSALQPDELRHLRSGGSGGGGGGGGGGGDPEERGPLEEGGGSFQSQPLRYENPDIVKPLVLLLNIQCFGWIAGRTYAGKFDTIQKTERNI